MKKPHPRDALSPDALALLDAVARNGSFAKAAAELGLVPSSLSYRVRRIEDALDVLLFDRSGRQARLTDAGAELLRQGQRLLQDMDAVAARVRRIATGWEAQLTIAADTVISFDTLMELAEAFFALGAPTRLRIREEALGGTLHALQSGAADLAIGVMLEGATAGGLRSRPLPPLPFVYAVAPHHPLARAPQPLSDEQVRHQRAVAVADSQPSPAAGSWGLLAGQEVFTVPTMRAKLLAQLRGTGVGFLPEPLARPHIAAGELVALQLERPARVERMAYAWPASPRPGRALAWWLEQLDSTATRAALVLREAAAATPRRPVRPAWQRRRADGV